MTFSLSEHGVRGVVLDIEGTTTPIAFVHDVLFPYARAHLDEFVQENQGPPGVSAVELHAQMDRDSKSPELKAVQGLIWERGYADGTLHGEVFPDVPPALDRWKAAGIELAIYSSGSVKAQQLLFRTTHFGDLTAKFAHFFDTAVGAKRERGSYQHIAAAMKHAPNTLLFVSDVPEELGAARAAGMQTLLCIRPGNAPQSDHDATAIRSFGELAL